MFVNRFYKYVAVASLAMSLYAGTAWANNPLALPENGLVLNGSAKQEYMTKYFADYLKVRGSAFVVPSGWEQQNLNYKNFTAEHYHKAEAAQGKAILYLHGGGYVGKAGNGHRLISLKEAELFGAGDVFMPDYRLAPKHVYPAALEDAAVMYQDMLDRGFEPSKIVFVGDSAGGNLAVSLAVYAREHNMPQPGAIILASPWSTLENKKGTSREYNLHKDVIVGKGTPLYPSVLKAEYRGKLSRKSPLISPIYSDLSKLPPMLIQAGGNEILLTECQALAAQAAKYGVEVTLTTYSEMPHDFALLLPDMQESINSLKEMQSFVQRYVK